MAWTRRTCGITDSDTRRTRRSSIFARAQRFVIVSEDTDYGELLAQRRTAGPSLVLLRTYEPMTPDGQAAVLLTNLPGVAEVLGHGAMVVIERTRMRVRTLPLGPSVPEQRSE